MLGSGAVSPAADAKPVIGGHETTAKLVKVVLNFLFTVAAKDVPE